MACGNWHASSHATTWPIPTLPYRGSPEGECSVTRRQPASRVRLSPHRVWDLLNRLNMTQNELATRAGSSSGYLSQLMSGTRRPSAVLRRRLMAALGVTRFDDLFILEAVE